MLRMLIPIDGSECSLRVVASATRLGTELQPALQVMLVNVQPPVPGGGSLLTADPSETRRIEESLKAEGMKLLAAAKEALDAAAVPNRLVVEIGEPEHIISSLARDQGCELIVMGMCGGGRTGLRVGSVATKVLHLSSVPVLLVS